MKKYFLYLALISLFILNCQKNSEFDDSHAPFLPEETIPLVAFTQHFDFNSSVDYAATAGAEISGGEGKLILGDTVDNATGAVGGDLDFSVNTSIDANLTLAGNKITMTSGTTGTFISRVINGMNTTQDWQRFKFSSTLPFGKELATGAEASYTGTVSDYSNSLLALYHLNETAGTVAVNVASGNNSGNISGGVSFNPTGKFLGAYSFNGSTGCVNAGSHASQNINNGTISLWMKTANAGGSYRTLVAKQMAYGLFLLNNELTAYDWFTASPTTISGISLNDNQWHHVAFVFQHNIASGSRLYIDGQPVGSAFTYLVSGFSTFLGIGCNAAAGQEYAGLLDEVGIWSRAMTAGEVQELYRRGANRLKVQVRGCTDATCSTNPTWVGVDGTNSTVFSELNNNSDPINATGTVATTPYETLWTTIAGLSPTFNTWFNTNKNSQYMQYKIIFESDSAALFPDFTLMNFDPTVRYATNNPSVYNLAASSTTFVKLSGISITEGACGSAIHYEIGNSSTDFLSWNGSGWAPSASYGSANSKATLEGLSTSSWNSFPKGSGNLYVRAYLPSNGTVGCAVDQISINGER